MVSSTPSIFDRVLSVRSRGPDGGSLEISKLRREKFKPSKCVGNDYKWDCGTKNAFSKEGCYVFFTVGKAS